MISKIINEGPPFVSPDGKFLFFTGGGRGKRDICWVSAAFIEELRPKEQWVDDKNSIWCSIQSAGLLALQGEELHSQRWFSRLGDSEPCYLKMGLKERSQYSCNRVKVLVSQREYGHQPGRAYSILPHCISDPISPNKHQ